MGERASLVRSQSTACLGDVGLSHFQDRAIELKARRDEGADCFILRRLRT
jgi:hypothetical protein